MKFYKNIKRLYTEIKKEILKVEAEIQDESVRKEVEMLQEFCKRFWNLQYLF